MDRYVLVRELDGMNLFLNKEQDGYTEDISNALQFDTEREVTRESIDDEQVAKILYDDNRKIAGYKLVEG